MLAYHFFYVKINALRLCEAMRIFVSVTVNDWLNLPRERLLKS